MARFILRGLPLHEQEEPTFFWFSHSAESAEIAVKEATNEGHYRCISVVGMVLSYVGEKSIVAFDPAFLALREKEVN